jgi:hypothetical protein
MALKLWYSITRLAKLYLSMGTSTVYLRNNSFLVNMVVFSINNFYYSIERFAY